MLLFGMIIWVWACLILLLIISSIVTIMGSLIYWYIFKKLNYAVVIIYNLLLIVPLHLWSSGVFSNVPDGLGLYKITFVLGFAFYYILFTSIIIHKGIIRLLETRLKKKNANNNTRES